MQGARWTHMHETWEMTDMAQQYPTNADDVIDSRDVIEAIEELTAALADEDYSDDDERDEMTDTLESLRKLAEEGETFEDWEYGVTLVRDSYWQDYAREMVEECGYFTTTNDPYSQSRGVDWSAWPYRCIDWEQVARELQQDYTAVEFDGVTYWAR